MSENPNVHCRTLTICNTRGLHARASANFVKCAEQFNSEITVSCKNQEVPGTSIMGLLLLAAQNGADITVCATGSDAIAALDAIEQLVSTKFGEE